MEEQILLYYLKVFSIIAFLLLTSIFVFAIYQVNKKHSLNNNILTITKGENFSSIINNINDFNFIEDITFKIYYRLNIFLTSNNIHYGDFYLGNKVSIYELLIIISKPSNVLNKITIIEGWSKKQLNNELSKYFLNYKTIEYEDILANTYYFEKNKDFNHFYEKIKKYKKDYFDKLYKSDFYKKYDNDDIIIIGSLIEKEGLDYNDKKLISSVIKNRLKNNMKLQIDATVLFAITQGNYNLNRNLSYNDLKIDNIFNTYKYNGLPPKPISYVGSKTIDIIMENYNSEYLFYFYNRLLKKHVFSKNYKEHKQKLNEYRNKK